MPGNGLKVYLKNKAIYDIIACPKNFGVLFLLQGYIKYYNLLKL